MANMPLSEDLIRTSIKGILKNADLNSLSSKKVRLALEEKHGINLTAQKQQVDDILMELINAEDEEKDGTKDDEEQDGGSSLSGQSENDEKNEAAAPPRKRAKWSANGPGSEKSAKKSAVKNGESRPTASDSSSEDEVDDEALARKLQQEELGVRLRNSRRPEKKPKKPTSTEKAPRKKGTSVYSQECVLSDELASVMGTNKMARKDVVSKMWQIFKERNLLDPKQKRYVICDEQLERIFKTKKFKAFGMMKILKHHIKDAKLVQS